MMIESAQASGYDDSDAADESDEGDPAIDDRDLSEAVQTDMCVLISGRPEVTDDLAWRIHRASGWRHGAFIVVDCNAPAPAVEERLFGVLAIEDLGSAPLPRARLRQAATVQLRNVDRLDESLQRRLADHLERMRARNRRRSSTRVIACTGGPLADRVHAGIFDDALFYRLNTIHLMIPTA